MIKNILEVVSLLFTIWLAGFAFCLLHYGMGGSGMDALSEHYRYIINLFM